MLRFRKPPLSYVAFLLVVLGIGAAVGHLVNAAGLTLFCFFIASIDPKPAWKSWLVARARAEEDGRGRPRRG